MAASIEEITSQLTALVRAKTGDARASVLDIAPLPGHAGFGYSFILKRTTAGGPSGKLVLRVAPEGVRISGPADVVRQAKIMESLAGTEVPVPPIIWYGDEAEFFGRPYFVDGFVDGFKLAEAQGLSRDETRRLALTAVPTLAARHRIDWKARQDAWGSEPTPLSDEMKRLDYLFDRPTLDPVAVARGPELRERLRSTLPEKPRIGCVHGDFQFTNILFDRNGVVALIDWEIALLGPTLLDLGWFCFFSDPLAWSTQATRQMSPLSPDEIVAAYSESARFPVSMDEVRWFRAFASYRFGVITCFNLMLHRRGKRHDPHWEEVALSAPRMFERGLELIG